MATTNKITISRSDFLESFVHLHHAIKDYDELVNLFSDDTTFSPVEIRDIVRSRMNNLEFGSVNVRAMEIIGTYLRYTLEKYTGEKLTFLIPDFPEDDFFQFNDGYVELSHEIEKVEEELKEIEEKIYYLSRLLPPFNVARTRLLLKTISGFFKSIIRKDVDDMNGHINHMHHLCASKESYFIINDVGHMVREIHNSLQDLSSQVPISELDPNIVDEMPDAIDKLGLVIQRMENSANSTLDSAENLLERNSGKQKENEELIDECLKLEERLLKIKENHQGAGAEIDAAIEDLKTNLKERLSVRGQFFKEEETVYYDIISNQSFQDLTGQTLKKIITFIEQLELKLLQILRKYSGQLAASGSEKEGKTEVSPLVGMKTKDGQILHGPQDNKPHEIEVTTQKDVDQVLAKFGF